MSETNIRYLYFNESLNVVYNIRPGSYKTHLNHFYSKFEIYYLLSGERHYFIKGRTFQIRAGDIVFINPYNLVETIDIGTQDFKRLAISFSEEYFANIPPNQKNMLFQPFSSDYNVLYLNDKTHNVINSLCQKIIAEVEQKQGGFEINLQALIIELLVYCSRNISLFQSDSSIPYKPAFPYIAEIVEYINANFSNKITLSQLSKQFYLSPSFLSRTFKQVTGFPFVTYLNLVRIIDAQYRLRKTNEPIIQIASEAGFGNISSFNRVFKTITTMSPSEYRKSFREAGKLN